MAKPILITSALPYVNNVPHLGNIIGCVLSADVCARYYRKKGKDVLYLCGTDEYGTTTEVKAQQEGLSCKEICDKYHALHKEIYDWFNISFDVWGRTTTDTHTKLTQEIFTKLWERGHLEEQEVEQYYDSETEMPLADRYINGKCYHPECLEKKHISNGDQCDYCSKQIDPLLLIDPISSVSGKRPIKKKSKHIYLKLGDFKKELEEFVSTIRISKTGKAIANSRLKDGLRSTPITRDLKWGTPFPEIKGLEDYKTKVFYVWFDAPIGYLSILKHNRDDWEKWFGDVEWKQFMAKDNVSFHTISFPATLIGTNNKYPKTTDISAIDYLNFEGGKFSKSKCIGVFGNDAKRISEKLGINEDYWRFYLLSIRPEGRDSSFEWKGFVDCINNILLNNIGNYFNRCISLSKKYYKRPIKVDLTRFENTINKLKAIENKYDEYLEKNELREALNSVCEMGHFLNTFFQESKPWDKSVSEEDKEYILGFSLWVGYNLLELLEPFIPNISMNIKSQYVKYSNKEIVLKEGKMKPPITKLVLEEVLKEKD